MLTANYDINDDWNISGLIGTNYNERSYSRRTVRGLDLSIPGFYDISATATQQALQSDWKRRLVGVYASARAAYKGYLYVNATARNDWCATLPIDANALFYPSFYTSFVFSEAFDLANDIFSFGKVRASIAQAGNDAPVYYTSQTFTQANPGDGTRGDIIFPFNGYNGFQLSSTLASIDLKPELVTEYELGTELKFLRNRLGLEFSYYNKTSNQQILSQPIASSTGFVSRVANAGKIVNSGIELMIDGQAVKTENFSWNLL